MAQKHRLFLLDAMAILYRAHFAFIKNPRMTSKGLNTSAIFGFTNTLMEIISKENPTYLGVAFDLSGPTFRHKQYPEYKAQREDQPEDIRNIQPYVYKLLKILDIPALSCEGYEADDIIGTISAQVNEDEFEVYMVTPDKDYAQLVKPNVYLYQPKYRGGGFNVLGEKEVEEKFGVPPKMITDYLGLMGDASDNIPGVPKIGPKTAVDLITTYGTLENILEQVEAISKKSIKASLKEFGDQGKLSKELATIELNSPCDWSVEGLKIGHMDLEAFMPLMKELEFRTVAQRILNSKLNPVQTGQADLFGNKSGTGMELPAELATSGYKTLETTENDYKLVDTPEARAELIDLLSKSETYCFDTETTGIDPMIAELVGIAFSTQSGTAYYVPCPEDREVTQAIVDEFTPLLTSGKHLKVGQNLKYDMLVLRNYGVKVAPPLFDTMLAHYLINPDGKHGMDAMARELLKYETVSITELIGKKGKNQKTMREVPVEQVVEYAGEDADITLQLYLDLAPKIKGNKVFEDIEMPLVPVLTEMEFAGIRVDDGVLADYSEELSGRVKTLETEIYEKAGEEFNINSPKQLGEILFDKLEIGPGKKAKKTKTGQYSTNEQILTQLAMSHELPERVLAYRSIQKLKSTYVDALPKLIHPDTGRVHTTYSQSVAVTGRLSSVNPNLQNIPIRTQDGREVRKGFVPKDAEHTLLSADYSQVELRIMAALSKDEAMMQAFQDGEDIHRASAARVFGTAPEDVTSDQRSAAKTVNFGIIYGISAFGLSQRMNIARGEASDIIKAYFEQYPRVKAYMDESVEYAKEHGYVETLFGRRRYLPDINSSNRTIRGFAERNAINSPIQGSAADIIKLAMIAVQQAFEEKQFNSQMLLQVHDELVFDVYLPELEEVKAVVIDKMEHAVELAVPLVVEAGTGKSWLEAH
ncbi:MAG: DNA polymerase I [Bacteroidota bacterium]